MFAKNYRYNKRGQIAIFVIIAIVLVVAILGFVFLERGSVEEKIDEQQDLAASVDVEVKPVYEFVQTCLEKYAVEGTDILGARGGYIYLPSDVETNNFFNDEFETIVELNNILEVEEKDGMNEIPFWATQDRLAIPSKKFMEEQLEIYLEHAITTCVNDFEGAELDEMNIVPGEINVEVGMWDFLMIRVEWPINIDYRGESFVVKNYEHRLPVNFEKIHSIAFALASNELAYTYLEEHAKSLISLYSYSGGPKAPGIVPPFSFSEVNQNCDSVSWTKDEVKSTLKSIFSKNFEHLHIGNTQFERKITGEPMSQGVYDSFIYDFFDREFPEVSIEFEYSPAHDIVLDISPSLGDSIVPDKVSQTGIPFFPNFCTFKYRYKYDIATPILIKIKDDESFRIGGGFEFYFPIKLFLCGNQERFCTGQADFLKDLNNADYFGSDYLDDYNTYDCAFVGAERNFNVRDVESNSAISNVDITHSCEGYSNTCYLGRTGEGGSLISGLPECSQPKIQLHKQDYALLETGVQENYQIERVKDMNVDVKLIHAGTFVKNYYLSNGFTSIHENCTEEYVSVEHLLEATDSDLRREEDSVTTILESTYVETPTFVYPQQTEIRFNSGNYEITSSYMSDVTIQPSTFCSDDECVTVSFDSDGHGPYTGPYSLGMYQYGWNVGTGELIDKNHILFKAIVEHYSDKSLEVRSFQNPVIRSDGTLRKMFYNSLDKDCDGEYETVDVSLSPEMYINFVKPELT